MITAVLDASVVGAVLFPEPHSATAHEWMERVRQGDARLTGPAFLQVELASIVWKRARRTPLASSVVSEHLRAILELPLRLIPDHELLARATEIGLVVSCTVYDGLYLAAAEAERSDLITADRRLAHAATSAGLSIAVRLVSPNPSE